MISGTTGLLGAADGAMILQKKSRTDKRAQLNIVGRELPDQEIIIDFSPESCTWQFIRSNQQLWEEPKDMLLEQVAALVSGKNKIWRGSATQMLQDLNIDDMKSHILTRKLNVKVDRLFRTTEFIIIISVLIKDLILPCKSWKPKPRDA